MIAHRAPLRRLLDGLLGGVAADGAAEREGQRTLLAVCLGAGLLAAAAFPLWLLAGAPGALFGVVAFAFGLAPIGIAAYLARTGRLAIAEGMALAAVVGLVAWLAAASGGLTSPLLVWLALVPLFAAGRAEGRGRWVPAAACTAALGFLVLRDAVWLTPIPDWNPPGWLTAASVMVAMTVLAARARALRAGAPAANGPVAPDESHRPLLDHGSDLVTRHGAGGRVEFASPAAERLLGVAPGDLVGDGLFALVQVADRPRFLKALSDAAHDGRETSADYRLRRRTADGQREDHIWVESRCRQLPGPAGGPNAVVAVTRDITARTMEAATAGDTRAAADAAGAAGSRILASFGLELRAPLSSIAVAPSTVDPNQRPIGAENFALAPLVLECVERMRVEATRRSVVIDVAPVATTVSDLRADRDACRQIVLNLLSSAVTRSPAGALVAVGISEVASGLRLVVADRGAGVAEAEIPRLGPPFLQVDSAYTPHFEGAAPGLATAKRLVALHGGQMSIAAPRGRGTAVTVIFPKAAGAAASLPHWAVAEPDVERRSA